MIRTLGVLCILLSTMTTALGDATGCLEKEGVGALATAWRPGIAGLEYLDRATFSCPQATITAIRFDSQRFGFALFDTHEEKRRIDQKLNRGGVFLDAKRQILRFGSNIATFANLGREADAVVAVTPASWWLDTEPVEVDGYLKIRNIEKNEVFGTQTALICLGEDGGRSSATLFYFQRKGVFSNSNWPEDKRRKFNACEHVFQSGPRIVEVAEERERLLVDGENAKNDRINCLKNEHAQAGFCKVRNPAVAARQRIVLIADKKDRYYLVYFHEDLFFYDIQRILLSGSFYGDSTPVWAVNLAGGERAGMFVKFGTVRLEYGNLEADLPSVLAIRKR